MSCLYVWQGLTAGCWAAGELVQVLAASNQEVPQAIHDLAMKHGRFRKGQIGGKGKGKGAGRGRKAQVLTGLVIQHCLQLACLNCWITLPHVLRLLQAMPTSC